MTLDPSFTDRNGWSGEVDVIIDDCVVNVNDFNGDPDTEALK